MIIKGQKNDYEVVIGLEVHAQLNTNTKLFSSSLNSYDSDPNTNINPVDIALPGSLPTINLIAIEKAVNAGLALNCTINKKSEFDRKNYFYPDLSSGYQITQFYYPIAQNGSLEINILDGENELSKVIKIERIHMEQDAGKLLHDRIPNASCVDFNRAGVPLIEIVTAPELRSPAEAVDYLKKLQAILRSINASDADLEKGSFRCDANISIMPIGSDTFGTRCEIKNINSFRFVAKAIEYEANRQLKLIENGEKVVQETRLYNAESNITVGMRSKEDAADYRYFPDPDLLPIMLSDDYIEKARANLPELPSQKLERYQQTYFLTAKEAKTLLSEAKYMEYFEELVVDHDTKACSSLLTSELAGKLSKMDKTISECQIPVKHLSDLLSAVKNGQISSKIMKDVLSKMLETNIHPKEIIEKEGLSQVSDVLTLEPLVTELIANSPTQVAEFKAGKDRIFSYFVGEMMKKTKGKANPELINQLIRDKLR